jgi:divalent metal cation (Fe/Co/Zn/Cd) transporter
MRQLTTPLDNILSLIHCADTYGHNNGVMMDAFAGLMDRKLSQEEIEAYAKELSEEEGYGQEDYDDAVETLTRFKKKYIDE